MRATEILGQVPGMRDQFKSLADYGEDRLLSRCDSYFFGLGHAIDAVVWAATSDGRLDYVNSYCNQLIEKPPLGTFVGDWPRIIHPDDYSRVLAAVEQKMQSDESFTVPVRFLMRGGQYTPFFLRGAWVPRRDQSLYRWVGTAIRADHSDPEVPTEEERKGYIMGRNPPHGPALSDENALEKNVSRKNDEALVKEEAQRMARRFEFLAEASAELSSSLDIHTVLQNLARLAVPRLADWIGVMELLPGQTLINLAHFHRNPGKFHWGMTAAIKYQPQEQPPVGSYYVLKTRRAQLLRVFGEREINILARSGQVYIGFQEMGVCSVIVAPMIARGRALGTISFTSGTSRRMYDESDLEFAEEIANRLALAIDHANAYSEARRLNQAKDEFLATLSHEMRTPLNVIMGYVDILSNSWSSLSPNEIHTSLETIQRNSKAQLQIVDDLLNMSSMVLGNIRLLMSRFSLAELVQHAVDSLSVMWKAKDLEVALDCTHAPPLMTADSARIEQIILNLLTNAIKYTPAGGRVAVTVETSGANVVMTVQDTGIGIEPEFLPFVFDRFSQENSTTTRVFGGLGLGLAIVRNLAELHGGIVQVRSEGRDRGSCFTVTLPIGAELPIDVEVKAERPPEQKSESMDLKGLRILLVEDDFDTRTLVRRYLERAGARVFEASSAAEGFQILQRGRPHLIVSDIGMPEEDGLSFIKRVRAFEGDPEKFTPAAALTAFTRPEDREKALEAGFQIYISKPTTKATLLAALTDLVQRFPVHG